ncbi:hypothetical protein ACFIOY_38540 [Bradyrhizobium sp. TZ2]
MAKRLKSKARVAKAKKARTGKFGQAMQALKGVGVPQQEFGRLNNDGNAEIDLDSLEALKKKLGKAAVRKVRFVALNAPFKRRSAIPPA